MKISIKVSCREYLKRIALVAKEKFRFKYIEPDQNQMNRIKIDWTGSKNWIGSNFIEPDQKNWTGIKINWTGSKTIKPQLSLVWHNAKVTSPDLLSFENSQKSTAEGEIFLCRVFCRSLHTKSLMFLC